MVIDLPPKLWLPQKPAIIRAASLDDAKVAMPLMGTFAAASVRGLRAVVGGNTPHRYWRISSIVASGSPNASWLLFDELEFLKNGVDLIPTMTGSTTSGVTITADTSTGNVPWHVGSNDGNYWEAGGQSGHWVKVDFGVGVAPDAYSIKGYPGWNPVNWLCEWSDDDSAWTTIDTQTGQNTYGTRIEYALPPY